MPKIDVFPLLARPHQVTGSMGSDAPCELGTFSIFSNNVRFFPKTADPYIWVQIPYNGNILKYTVPADLYNCIGWNRGPESYTVVVWDSKVSCTFVIPAVGNV